MRSTPEHFKELTREELEALVRKQSRIIDEMRKQIEELRRKSLRQASPFSKNQPKANPKRPGRKAGEGSFKNRPAPPEQAMDRKVQASTPEQCPHCGGGVELERVDLATVTDMPANPEPVVTRYAVPVCRCRKCGKRVRGQAAGLASDQSGATAHRVGPRAMAMAHLLHYDLGIPVRKVPLALLATTGIWITSSAITQNALRLAEGPVGLAYEQLRDSMRCAPVVYTDDTGWRIGGRNAFLMGFDSNVAAVYQIRYQHRNEEVREIIPMDFDGVLVTDRGKSYDAREFAGIKQQKCIGHLLRNASLALESKSGGARSFGAKLKALLQEAMQLGKSPPSADRTRDVQDLERRLTRHLRNRHLRDEDNRRLLNGIGIQMDRGHLLRFLHHDGVEATNNRAERMLRPAVIARKVSHCSKNERGAYATSAFLSVIQTSRKSLPAGSARSLAAPLEVLLATAAPDTR